MKKTIFFNKILSMFVLGIMISSCADDFTEEDLINAQKERADAKKAEDLAAEEAFNAANAAELAAAANVTYAINVYSDNEPIAGATITITNQSGTTASATSDANGNVAFNDIALGGYTVDISSDNHLNVSYLVDFGSPQEGVHYEVVNDIILGMELSEATKVELLPTNGLQTATVMGTVNIETDLTNKTPEIPQGITVRANLDKFSGMIWSTNNSYSGFNSSASSFYVPGSLTLKQGDIGTAMVDPLTGAYTMIVPAQEGGTDVQLLFPIIEADQTLAYSIVNGMDVGLQVGMQAAVYEPGTKGEATPANVPGVMATFPSPPPPGRGFSVAFDPVPLPRTLGIGLINEFPSNLNGINYYGTFGSGDFQLSPTITVDDPDLSSGQKAEIVPTMEWTIESFDINSGVGFGFAEMIELNIEVTYSNGFKAKFPTGITQQANAGNLLPMSYTNLNIVFETSNIVTSITISQGDGNTQNATINSSNIMRNGEIMRFVIAGGGSGYTSIPNITIGNEGSPTTPATLEITDMSFNYSFDVDNSGVTQPYVKLPEIDFEYEQNVGDFNVSPGAQICTLDENGFINQSTFNNLPLEDYLVVSGNQLLFDDDFHFLSNNVDRGYISSFSYSVPKLIIIEPTHKQITADVVVIDGKVTGLTNVVGGSGYNSKFEVMLSTLGDLPGTGASIILTNFDTDRRTGEITWRGANPMEDPNDHLTIVSEGTNYTLDVNIAAQSAPANPIVTVRNGETVILNYNYGTGVRVNKVEYK